MVVQRKDSGKVDMYVNEQETDVEEGSATLEDERVWRCEYEGD